MQPFNRLTGIAAPLDIADLDTDQLVPKQFLKTVERGGLGRALLFDLRFDEQGNERPGFVLNRPEFRNAVMLVAGANFGCGSSREHAPWALLDYGIRCVIAPSFAEIFYENCFENGLLPLVLPADLVSVIVHQLYGGPRMTVDLARQELSTPAGVTCSFAIDADRKDKLLRGSASIDATLEHAQKIDAFERTQALPVPRRQRP